MGDATGTEQNKLPDVVDYKSADLSFTYNKNSQLETKEQNGLNWVATYDVQLSMLTKLTFCGYLSWTFEWVELQKTGVDGFIGHIVVSYTRNEKIPAFKFDVQLTESGQKIRRRIGINSDITKSSGYNDGNFKYELSLQPYCLATRNFPIDQLFISSSDTDGVLLVEDYKVHVNKSFLSMHSDFFRSLFSSNFKEGSMDEIPIGEVKYEDFSRLLAIINPNPILPTDETVESLLKLAEYFQMPFVVSIIELHLFGASHFDFFQSLFIADKYNMKKLIDKCIALITTLDHVKQIKTFAEYDNLTDVTKSKILDRLMQVV